MGVAWMVLGAGQLSVGREGGKTQLKEPRPELEIREKRNMKEPGRANEPGMKQEGRKTGKESECEAHFQAENHCPVWGGVGLVAVNFH